MKIEMILARLYCDNLDKSIDFYEKLFGYKIQSRFNLPGNSIELARIDNLLLIGGNETDLKEIRKTNATYLVDSIDAFRTFLIENNGKILRDKTIVPTGWNMTAQHPDGAIIEYVEFKK